MKLIQSARHPIILQFQVKFSILVETLLAPFSGKDSILENNSSLLWKDNLDLRDINKKLSRLWINGLEPWIKFTKIIFHVSMNSFVFSIKGENEKYLLTC